MMVITHIVLAAASAPIPLIVSSNNNTIQDGPPMPQCLPSAICQPIVPRVYSKSLLTGLLLWCSLAG